MILYGIANCDTVAKARAWLSQAGMTYEFHDYKKAGVDPLRLTGWCDALDWEKVLNRAGTTFKKLPDAEKVGLTRDKAVTLMLAAPSLIKRPILEHPGGLLLGFKADVWAEALISNSAQG